MGGLFVCVKLGLNVYTLFSPVSIPFRYCFKMRPLISYNYIGLTPEQVAKAHGTYIKH